MTPAHLFLPALTPHFLSQSVQHCLATAMLACPCGLVPGIPSHYGAFSPTRIPHASVVVRSSAPDCFAHHFTDLPDDMARWLKTTLKHRMVSPLCDEGWSEGIINAKGLARLGSRHLD